jgi:hypothetical protein
MTPAVCTHYRLLYVVSYTLAVQVAEDVMAAIEDIGQFHIIGR